MQDSNGLKTRDFEEKMGVLQQERHHKMRVLGYACCWVGIIDMSCLNFPDTLSFC